MNQSDISVQSSSFLCIILDSTIFMYHFRLYSKSNQVLVFKDDLNNNHLKDGSDIIDVGKGSSDWFAKGHLSPDAAFIYDFEQEATYFFINVDPQFQSFNNGNWKAAEAETRKLASKLVSSNLLSSANL